jgi:uncharacterized membrane protein
MAFTITFILLVLFLVLLIYSSIASLNWRKQNLGSTTMNEHEHYYFRFFYFNPNDKRIMLYKRGGGGYTLNFASPISILIVLAIIALLILPSLQ